MPTIIDGYNLIFQCGLEGRTRTPITLERARDRLIAALVAALSEKKRARITIVFDAKRLPIKETQAVSKRQGIKVIFAVDHEDADTLIEELIRKHSTPKRLTVVSSDHRIHKAALRRKATPVDSDVWFDRLESKAGNHAQLDNTQPHDSGAKPDSESLRDIDWHQEFGLDDTEDDASPPAKDPTYNPFPPGYGEDLLDGD